VGRAQGRAGLTNTQGSPGWTPPSNDEPGAADFYYGEMEMRRHSQGWSRAERWLLQAYWLLSGYGLRASRALGWLALAMFITVLMLMGYGLPNQSPRHEVVREKVDGAWKWPRGSPSPCCSVLPHSPSEGD
jgi:hypothetical protein